MAKKKKRKKRMADNRNSTFNTITNCTPTNNGVNLFEFEPFFLFIYSTTDRI